MLTSVFASQIQQSVIHMANSRDTLHFHPIPKPPHSYLALHLHEGHTTFCTATTCWQSVAMFHKPILGPVIVSQQQIFDEISSIVQKLFFMLFTLEVFVFIEKESDKF